jgi:hypothetical protein
VITGFNTDVPFDGVTYHVQTEDKGLETPLILSLVYVGGAIIASKRTRYEDLISKGFDEQMLIERLQRQHKLICAAIKSGRVEDLKRMGGASDVQEQEPEAQVGGAAPAGKKPGGQRRKKSEPAPSAAEAIADAPAKDAAPAPASGETTEPEIVILATLAEEINALGEFSPPHAAPKPSEPPVEAPPMQAAVVPANEAAVPEPVLTAEFVGAAQELSNELYLTLLDDEGEFRAGQLATVKVYVGRGAYGQRPEAAASVTVKVLGTSFRPLILTTATDALGIGVVRALLPRFTSGRAAIIIRAVAGDDSAEMRRIIHQ